MRLGRRRGAEKARAGNRGATGGFATTSSSMGFEQALLFLAFAALSSGDSHSHTFSSTRPPYESAVDRRSFHGSVSGYLF